jgi:Tat protein secretion system quality control protein TatD with DNase activity
MGHSTVSTTEQMGSEHIQVSSHIPFEAFVRLFLPFSTDDIDNILLRARQAGVGMQLLTGDSLSVSREVLELAKKHSTYSSPPLFLPFLTSPSTEGLYTTVGLHPCRATEMDAYEGGVEAYAAALDKLLEENKGVAVAGSSPSSRVLHYS